MKKHGATVSRQKPDSRLYERCAVLAEVVRAIKPIYNSPSATRNQRQLLETMIGAAIWYFPQPDGLWTGKISVEAVKAKQARRQATRDHMYPQKVAAHELLLLDDSKLTADNIHSLYREKFGKFNLVTKEENRKLMRYQKAEVFVSPEKCYEEAGVKLIEAKELGDAISALRESSRAAE